MAETNKFPNVRSKDAATLRNVNGSPHQDGSKEGKTLTVSNSLAGEWDRLRGQVNLCASKEEPSSGGSMSDD